MLIKITVVVIFAVTEQPEFGSCWETETNKDLIYSSQTELSNSLE